jgi:hypothetical protein
MGRGSTVTTEFTDLNARKVHAFASQMANLGFERMTEELVTMLDSGAWLEFKDGLGTYSFLPGEFDYFLTQQGIGRELVMKGVQDLDAKARLEHHMDERRTNETDYRRRIIEVREANPRRPGRPIEPFGYTVSEAKILFADSQRSATAKPPLGDRVRRYVNTGGQTTKTPRDKLPRVVRLSRSALRLSDEDLESLIVALGEEQRRRRDNARG